MIRFITYKCDVCGKEIARYGDLYKFKCRDFSGCGERYVSTMHMCSGCFSDFKTFVRTYNVRNKQNEK